MPLTTQQVKEAIETGHTATCTTPKGCIHAKALQGARTEIEEDVMKGTLVGLEVGGPRLAGPSIWNCGFHAGYRAAQLVAEAEAAKAKEKVN